MAREVMQRLLLFPLLRVLCAPLVVLGSRNVPRGSVLVVANHGGHADAPLVIKAMPWRLRRRLAPGAAADYFFGHRWSGAFASLLTGCFPFARRGSAGLDRAREYLRAGWSVLLFPEGTRSHDGSLGEFKVGAGILAAEGVTVLPVGLAGSYDVLPRGRWLPRRAPVAVAIGRPERFAGSTPDEIAATLRRRVQRLVAQAEAARPARRTWYERAGSLARSKAGLVLAFCWGVAEALWWPIVPDYLVALLVVAAPGRCWKLALAAAAGSVTGGMVAYGLGALGAGGMILGHTPLLTERMHGFASGRMASEGGSGLMTQPWSGVPFKVYAYRAAEAGLGLGTFGAWAAIARGYRLVLVAGVGGAWGAVTKRLMPRLYGAFAIGATAFFLHGLARVVAHWS